MNFKEDFAKANRKFLYIISQYKEVKSISNELEKITKGKKFIIHNRCVYDLYINQYQNLFVKTYQFCKYMYSPGGPLAKGEHNYYNKFRFVIKTDQQISKFSFEKRFLYFHAKDLIDKFFTCQKCQYSLCKHNFSFLESEFQKLGNRISEARHCVSHIYEKDFDKRIKNVDFSLQVLELIIKEINKWMGILSWFADIQWSTDISLYTDETHTAKDIVDQILCGTISQIPFDLRYNVDEDYRLQNYSFQDRDNFYHRLHEMHDKLDPNTKKIRAFNFKSEDNSIGVFFSNEKMNLVLQKKSW